MFQSLKGSFLKIQVWILKSEGIRKRIFCFFTKLISVRSLGSSCVKVTEESTCTLEVDSSLPLTHHDPRDLELICLVKKRKIHFRIFLRIQSLFLSLFLRDGRNEGVYTITKNWQLDQKVCVVCLRLIVSLW